MVPVFVNGKRILANDTDVVTLLGSIFVSMLETLEHGTHYRVFVKCCGSLQLQMKLFSVMLVTRTDHLARSTYRRRTDNVVVAAKVMRSVVRGRP